MAREVVARSEVDVPPLGQRDVARTVERLVEREGVAHVGAANGLRAVFHHRDAVGEGEVPGQGEGQITVFVDLGFGLLLGFVFLLAEHGVDVGIFLRIAVVELLLVGVGVRVAGARHGVVVAIGVEDFVPSATGEEAEKGHEFLPVEGVGKVLAHALEATEAAVAPLGAVAHDDVALVVELIGVGGPLCGEGEGVALGEAQAEVGAEVGPGAHLRGEVVGEGGRELVDERDFAVARGVGVRFDLHLEIVRHAEVEVALPLGVGVAEGAEGVGRVADGRDGAVGFGANVVGGETARLVGEVGGEGEGDGGLEDVADGLDAIAEEEAHGLVEAVERGVGREGYVPIEEVVEPVDGVDALSAGGGVPRFALAREIGAPVEVEGGREVDVFEELEVGGEGNAVLHAVAPLENGGVEKLRLGGGERVGHLSGVGEREFFVPALFADGFLAAEGIEAVDGERNVGQGDGEGGVAHVLRHVGRGRKREAERGNAVVETHRRGTGALGVGQRRVEGGEIGAFVVLGGEVDAGGERGVGVGLGVGAVAPLHFEGGLLVVVGEVFVAVDGGEVGEEDVAAIGVAAGVVALGRETPRAAGVDFAEEFEVDAVGEGKIVTAVAQVETAGGLVAVGGHDETGGVFFVDGEEAVGDGDGQGHIGHDEIGGAEERLFAGGDFGAGELETEVRMLGVAGGVLGVLEIEVAVAGAFGVDAAQIAGALGGFHVVDEALLGLEVEGHLATFVVFAPLGVDGLALQAAGAVGYAGGAHERGVHVEGDVVGLETHVLILHIGLSVEVGESALGVVDEAVFGGVFHGSVEARLAEAEGVGLGPGGGVATQAVGIAQAGIFGHGEAVGGDAGGQTVGRVGMAQAVEGVVEALGVGACAVVADGEAVGEGGGAQAVGIGGQTVDGVGKEGTLGRAGGAVPGEERGGVAGQCEKPEEQRR